MSKETKQRLFEMMSKVDKSFKPKLNERFGDVDGSEIWSKAHMLGKKAMDDYIQETGDEYGFPVTSGSIIWIKGKPFPNPTYDIQLAGLESMGRSRVEQDEFKKMGADGNIEWYGIPNFISQGSKHQEIYANKVIEYLNSMGFEAQNNI